MHDIYWSLAFSSFFVIVCPCMSLPVTRRVVSMVNILWYGSGLTPNSFIASKHAALTAKGSGQPIMQTTTSWKTTSSWKFVAKLVITAASDLLKCKQILIDIARMIPSLQAQAELKKKAITPSWIQARLEDTGHSIFGERLKRWQFNQHASHFNDKLPEIALLHFRSMVLWLESPPSPFVPMIQSLFQSVAWFLYSKRLQISLGVIWSGTPFASGQ